MHFFLALVVCIVQIYPVGQTGSPREEERATEGSNKGTERRGKGAGRRYSQRQQDEENTSHPTGTLRLNAVLHACRWQVLKLN